MSYLLSIAPILLKWKTMNVIPPPIKLIAGGSTVIPPPIKLIDRAIIVIPPPIKLMDQWINGDTTPYQID